MTSRDRRTLPTSPFDGGGPQAHPIPIRSPGGSSPGSFRSPPFGQDTASDTGRNAAGSYGTHAFLLQGTGSWHPAVGSLQSKVQALQEKAPESALTASLLQDEEACPASPPEGAWAPSSPLHPASSLMRSTSRTTRLLSTIQEEQAAVEAKVATARRAPTPASKAIVFGLVNAVAAVPSLIAYAAIVFKDPIYTPYLDLLCKFFFVSSAVHQLVFVCLSALPFAIGQVQDVGLIFMSAMATSIAGLATAQGQGADVALGTSLLTMTISTTVVGIATLLVARYKLAELVQYLPLPVIGGYLGFVGYFCIASGLALACSVSIDTISSWANLASVDALTKLVPAVLSTLAMIMTMEHFNHPLALSGVLTTIVLAFHAGRLLLGWSLEDAMDRGWVLRPAEGKQEFWELWSLFNIHDFKLDGILVSAGLAQIGKLAGLILVVCFGSCMDVAAIQQDLPERIDFDHELVTVGVSNVITGLTGIGYCGSYIFSQTIFTMRAGVFSRWNGIMVAAVELTIFLLPFSIVQYMPNFFFGALLVWFGVEISRDWLFLSFYKLTRIEYGVLWLTFAFVMQLGLEGGIFAGIVLATLYFTYAYAQSQISGLRIFHTMTSNVVRTMDQQAALQVFATHCVVARFQGFVFFGSAHALSRRMDVVAGALVSDPSAGDADAPPPAELALAEAAARTGEAFSGTRHTQAVAALRAAPRFLVLDFTRVRGMDATGARTFAVLCRDLLALGVTPLLAALDHHGVRPLLAAHGVPMGRRAWPPEVGAGAGAGGDGAGSESAAGAGGGWADAAGPLPSHDSGSLAEVMRLPHAAWTALPPGAETARGGADAALVFDGLQAALRYAEDQYVSTAVRYGLCRPPLARLTLADLVRAHLDKLPVVAPGAADDVAATLVQYLDSRVLQYGEVLWRLDAPAQQMFIVEKGSLRVDQHRFGAAAAADRAEDPDAGVVSAEAAGRSFELGPGCVAGSTDFFLARPHGSQAVCSSPVARVLALTRQGLTRLAAEVPQVLAVLQVIIMRANTLDLTVAAEVGHAGQVGD
ncbi:hypothetical protein ACKKBF_B10080 [Auxenochlorella protothecoides x Auxenochlorella symbiontica]|uniref:STAS domain-containing protein n=1 Tax=Auxenochlorella protothecoides TaxID=3075 RepID=A0A1D1ZT25_AUXPR